MLPSKHSKRGVAAEIVILAVVLFGGAGWFGVKNIKEAIKEEQISDAVEEANDEAKVAVELSKVALAERDRADHARQMAEAALQEVKDDNQRIGRTIQESSAKASVAVEQLPLSPERWLLNESISNIDLAANGVFGRPADAEIAEWKRIAEQALAGEAAAVAQVSGLKHQIAKLIGERDEAQVRAKELRETATEAEKKAKDSQHAVDLAVKDTQTLTDKADRLTGENNVLKAVKGLFLVIVCIVGGMWLLGLLSKLGFIGMGGKGPIASVLNTFGNAFHSILAPAAVVSESHARRETNKLIDSTGSFIHDLRRTDKTMADKVTERLDIALSPKDQERVRRAYQAFRNACIAGADDDKLAATDAAAANP